MTTAAIDKTASVKLPGLGQLWKKKKVPLRSKGPQAPSLKTASIRTRIRSFMDNHPNFTSKLTNTGAHIKDMASAVKSRMPSAPPSVTNAGSKLKDIWDRAGGSTYRDLAARTDKRIDEIGGVGPRAQRLDDLAAKAERAASRAKTTRNVAAAGVPAAAGAYGATQMMDGGDETAPVAPAENVRLQQRMDSPFGGLWDDIINPESDADAAARTARLQELGDNATLMQRWQLADPKIRTLLMALLLAGGGGLIGAMRR